MNTDGISGEISCVGTARKTSINDLLNVTNQKYSSDVEAYYLDTRSGDIKESICDNKKIKNMLRVETFKKFEEEIIKL